MTERDELNADLELATNWYRASIRDERDPVLRKQLRYSLCNKLAADWQKFVKATCVANGVPTEGLGNCWPSQVKRAYRSADQDDPFDHVPESELGIFDELNPVRNMIDHGEEPPPPTNEDFEEWIRRLRNIGATYGS